MTSIRIEAEDMVLTTYRTESSKFASGGKLISLRNAAGSTGTAEAVFTGEEGNYDVVIGYYDENDGVSRLQVSLGGDRSDEWQLDQDLGSAVGTPQSFMQRTVATGVSLKQGTTIEIQGTTNQGEWVRVDYIEFIPAVNYGTKAADTLNGDAQNNTINGVEGDDTLYGDDGNDILIGGTGNDILDGGAGIDTASYAQATSGIIANLDTGVVTRIAKIMPMGDSITKGKVNNTNLQNFGGYRTLLSESFEADGLTMDFVGSQSSGPDSLGDKDHEGHPGKSINWIDDHISGSLNTYTPDIILLMAGTNDTGNDSVSQMKSDLSNLIDKITQQLPDTQLLVASIPPINSAGQPQTRVQKALNFNAVVPDIVDDKVADGKQVKFVDMRSLTADDISLPPEDNGLHPTIEGYGKIANFWNDALSDLSIDQGTFSVDQDTLSNIENIVGTNFNDTLVGNADTNIITGGAGRDILTGGGGVDTFIYEALTQGEDIITDFNWNDDIFQISASGFGGGLEVGVPLNMTDSTTGVLVSDANPTPISTSANFLYATDTGLLSFDQDGTGSDSAVAIATLNGLPALNLERFKIIA